MMVYKGKHYEIICQSTVQFLLCLLMLTHLLDVPCSVNDMNRNYLPETKEIHIRKICKRELKETTQKITTLDQIVVDAR